MSINYTIHDSYSGAVINCTSEQNVLSAISLDGRCNVLVGCRGGGCGKCRIDVLDGQFECGKMSRRHAPEEAINKGKVLACRLYPRSDLIINTAPDIGK
ncbi:2Fe-2S iron-sulfur cluster-binding protein [Zhongshania sp. BJYM1]|uniref:2Fe-2S iron-sulfur cluster-binding protein n=1 Tax=Zhongshania aquatica TaxID=2965069 RepID=UPI00331307F5